MAIRAPDGANKEATLMGKFELCFPMYVCMKPDLSLSTRAGGLLPFFFVKFLFGTELLWSAK